MKASANRLIEVSVVTIFVMFLVFLTCVLSARLPRAINNCGNYKFKATGTKDNDIIHQNKVVGVAEKEEEYKNRLGTTEVPLTEPSSSSSPTLESSSTSAPNSNEIPSNPMKSVTVYAANNHVGRQTMLTFEDPKVCKNLPDVLRNKVQSVNTHGNCIILCDELNCGGWCEQFEPGSPWHNRLRKLRFHNKAESAIPCKDSESEVVV